MKRHPFRSLTLAAGALALAAGTAPAQPPVYQQPPRAQTAPPVSPYLNMTRGGNPAINYETLVRPQIETARSLEQLQLQVVGCL